MNILGIIPARFASSRFPGKPLVDIGGKSMIQRVYEQAKKSSKLSDVVVATDDDRIANEVKRFGGKFIMTSDQFLSGTDRCAEAVKKVPGSWKAVINIQGDEPFILPQQIDLLAGLFGNPEIEIGTLVKKLIDSSNLDNPNTMKVVLDIHGNAMYFSRSPIPFVRGVEKSKWLEHNFFYHHIGIYGYRVDILEKIAVLPQGKLELAESLEQLRWLANGFKIRTAFTEFETLSVDTPEDLEKLKKAGLI